MPARFSPDPSWYLHRGTSASSFARSPALWDAAADTAPHDGPARVGLVLDVLVDARAPQLFDVDPGERRLQGLLDAVRERYAAPALVWGRCSDPEGRYTGAKIAYQSFPDKARLRWLGVV